MKPYLPHGQDWYAVDVMVGERVVISPFTNLYGCELDDDVFIGPFVEVQSEAVIGARTRVSSHSFICTGMVIGPDVFVGHGVMTCNDRMPFLEGRRERLLYPPIVKTGSFVGSGAVILPGVTIGENAMIGAGAVVAHDVPAGQAVIGNPARPTRSGGWPLRPVEERTW